MALQRKWGLGLLVVRRPILSIQGFHFQIPISTDSFLSRCPSISSLVIPQIALRTTPHLRSSWIYRFYTFSACAMPIVVSLNYMWWLLLPHSGHRFPYYIFSPFRAHREIRKFLVISSFQRNWSYFKCYHYSYFTIISYGQITVNFI